MELYMHEWVLYGLVSLTAICLIAAAYHIFRIYKDL